MQKGSVRKYKKICDTCGLTFETRFRNRRNCIAAMCGGTLSRYVPPKPIRLGSATLRILKYLSGLGNTPVMQKHYAETTRYYAHDWPRLAKLRELGFIEPGHQSSGSMVTEKGREYLASVES